MTKDEALELALEALEEPKEHFAKHRRLEAITAIKEALAQPEQESVAMADYMAIVEKCAFLKASQRTWVGLTDEERNNCLVDADPCECLADPEAEELMRCIEDKLRSKNGY